MSKIINTTWSCLFFKNHEHYFNGLLLIFDLFFFMFEALHWIMAEEPQTPDVPVPLLDDLMIHPDYLGAEDPRTWLRRQLLVSHEKVNQTAAATIRQRENALWAAIRKLRFTASNFGHFLSAFDRKK